jgi:hypothetical protein
LLEFVTNSYLKKGGSMNTLIKLTAAVICGLALTACGGGGGDDGGGNSTGGGNTGNGSDGNGGGSGSGGQTQTAYTVTPSTSGTGGAISPATPVSVQPGAVTSFTLTPNSGYTVASVGGTCGGTRIGNTYTTKAVTADCTVVAAFSGGTAYTVTPSVSGSGGTISPVTPVSVQSGATAVFTLTPNSGYSVSAVGGTCGGALNGNTYTTNAISASCTVIATFTSIPSKAVAAVYEGQPVASDATSFLSLLNQEGAKGYRYLYDQSFVEACTMWESSDGTRAPCGPFPAPVSVFVNDGAAPSYTYDLLPNPGNMTDFITQANAEGAKGYLYTKWYGTPNTATAPITPPAYVLYRKNGGSTATYTYIADVVTGPAASVDDFLNQVNTRGQSGYWFFGRVGGYYPTQANLYVKNNASNAIYAYDAVTLGATSDVTYLDQINAEGTNGYREIYELTPNVDIPEGNLFAMLYIKDNTQSATFTFQSTDPAADGTTFVNQLNNYGAQGYATFMNLFLYSFKTTNCNGWLCMTSGTLKRYPFI